MQNKNGLDNTNLFKSISTLSPQAMSHVVEAIKSIESPNWTDNLPGGRLVILDANLVFGMLEQLQEQELETEHSEKLATFTPEHLREILDRIKDGEAAADDQTSWAMKLAARPFAVALFDAATQTKQQERVAQDLSAAVRILESGDTVRFLQDPEVRFEEKNTALEQNLGQTHPLVMNLLFDLMSNNKLNLLVNIDQEFQRLSRGSDSVARATLTTAVPMDDDDMHKINRRLESLIGRRVVIESQIDPDIIGGFILVLGSQKIDASLRRKLASLRNDMQKKIRSHE
jgi:F-type H+-transporting ATPase subunit delta